MISLCMIARDEEKHINDCLKAALPAVDEIVLVDTGSRDRTVEIAKWFNARIYHYKWRDDFSAARNEALKRAKGDWILALDADEILAPEAPQIIQRAVAAGTHSGFALPLVSPIDNGQDIACRMVRLFVNRPEIRYRYLIHEQIIPDLNHYARRCGKPVGYLNAKIIHLGYRDEAMNDHNKNERNKRIFLKQLDLYPKDAYSWYKYADFLRTSDGPKEETFQALEKAYALLRSSSDHVVSSYSFAGEAAAYLGLYFFELKKDPEKALCVLQEGAKRFLATPHLFFVKARIEKEQGNFKDAVHSFKRCLSFQGKQDLLVPVANGISSWKSMTGLGLCYLALGKMEMATAQLERSIKMEPRQVEPYAGLAEVAYKSDDLKEAMNWLIQLLKQKPDYSPAWNVGSEILARMGLHDQAQEWKSRSRQDPRRPIVHPA